MARILILAGAHAWMFPRARREATALAGDGHEVTLGALRLDDAGLERDVEACRGQPWRHVVILDLRPARRLANLRHRLQRKAAGLLLEHAGIESRAALGYGVGSMQAFALRFRADLTIVHGEVAFGAGGALLRSGAPVGVDLEDWHSEDALPGAEATRPMRLLRGLEAGLLRGARYAVTTSVAMAGAVAQAYEVPRPAVVYNVPADAAAVAPTRTDGPELSVAWLSQTVGPGRGLELLMEALPRLDRAIRIHLLGRASGAARAWLAGLSPEAATRVVFHDLVPEPRLGAALGACDVGLALETGDRRNKDLTISNKFFHYLQAGLAVVATGTRGQREAAALAPAACRLLPSGTADALAAVLNGLQRDRAAVRAAQHAAQRAAREVFPWEAQARVVREQARRALAPRG